MKKHEDYIFDLGDAVRDWAGKNAEAEWLVLVQLYETYGLAQGAAASYKAYEHAERKTGESFEDEKEDAYRRLRRHALDVQLITKKEINIDEYDF